MQLEEIGTGSFAAAQFSELAIKHEDPKVRRAAQAIIALYYLLDLLEHDEHTRMRLVGRLAQMMMG